VKVTLLLAQIEVELAEIEIEGVTELAVIEITLEVAVGVVMQLAFDVMITVTWSPLASEVVVKVDELAPVFMPFICH
jgi:hypothetical protein